MAKLVHSFNGRTLGEYPLFRERTTIGRAPDNDIRIDNLAVSGHHAAILAIHGECFIEDLQSTNGTFINGQQSHRQLLREGDYIGVGKHTLRFHEEASDNESEVEKTVAVRSVRPDPDPIPAPAAREQVAGLTLMTGANAGREMILSKALTRMGKADVQVAAISKRQNDYFLVHVSGQNGRTPILNGESIGTQARKLNNGDTLEIAGNKLSFFLRDA